MDEEIKIFHSIQIQKKSIKYIYARNKKNADWRAGF